MSIRAIDWAFRLDVRGASKAVLIVLANFADEEAACFPSQARVARMAGLSERTVRSALEALIERGLVSRQARYGGAMGRKTDRYVLSLEVTASGDLPADPAAGNSHRRQTMSDLPANPARPTGKSRLPITVREPLEEPSDLKHGAREPEPAGEVAPLGSDVTIPSSTAGFDAAYESWPKKTERKLSAERWPAAVRRHPGGMGGLVADVQRFAAAYVAAGVERRFVPALAVWLRHERWIDEPPQPQRPVLNRATQRDIEDFALINALRAREEAQRGTFRDGNPAEVRALPAGR